MKLDSLVHNIIELDCYYEKEDVKSYHGKIHEIMQQLSEVRPDVEAAISRLYEKADVYHFRQISLGGGVNILTSASKESFKTLEEGVLNIIAKAMPDLKIVEKIKKQKEFEKAILDFERSFYPETHLAIFESLLKEGADVNAPLSKEGKNQSCFSYLLNHLPLSEHALLKAVKLCLKHGAIITDYAAAKLFSFFEADMSGRKITGEDEELLELMMAQGFNIDFINPPDTGSSLLAYTIRQDETELARLLIYHGASSVQGLYADDAARPRQEMQEMFAIRDAAIHELHKTLPTQKRVSYQQMTLKQRIQVARLCRQIENFRRNWKAHAFGEKSIKILSSEENQTIKHHEAFVKAISDKNLDEAGKLLKQGFIDLNAPLIAFSSPLSGTLVPFLTYAIVKGDLELTKFLIEAGADVSVCVHDKDLGWPPPLLIAALTPVDSQRDQMIDLLMKAGANPNQADFRGNPYILSMAGGFLGMLEIDPASALRNLIKCGLDPNIQNPFDGTTLCNLRLSQVVRRKLIDELIFYGYNLMNIGNMEKLYFLPHEKEAIWQIIGMRNEIFEEMVKEKLMASEDIKALSADLVGVIQSFKPFNLSDISPKDRLELHDRCLAKLASEKAKWKQG